MWSKFKASASKNHNYDDFPSFKNIPVLKCGIDFTLFNWMHIMGGYYFQPSFVPDSANKEKFNFLDNDKHVVSAGLKFLIPPIGRFLSSVEIDITYQFQYLAKRSVTKNSPTELNPNYSYNGVCHTAMIGITMKI